MGKAARIKQKHLFSHHPKKFKYQPSAGKVMLTVYFDINLLMLVFKDPHITINA
jgi:hypothetical protein